MADEPDWDDIFTSQPGAATSTDHDTGTTDVPADAAPRSRRELRGRGPAGHPRSSGPTRRHDPGEFEPVRPRRNRRRIWIWAGILAILLGGVAVTTVWITFEDQIRKVLGWSQPDDYVGAGTKDVVIVIQAGDIGGDVARTLAEAGVTKSFDAFYRLLLVQDPPVEFQPGNFALKTEMSAQAALDALVDPANKITNRVTVPEGTTMPSALELLSSATGIPLADFQAAAADYASLGVPADAPSLEGYLFPASYPLDPGVSAHDVLQLMVNEMYARLDAAGVALEDRHRVLTLASIIQRESGPVEEDFYKISRVFTNRLETDGWNLESDATVAYGTGNFQTVWTTDEERADASNPYNTYANPGLPIGPIGLPGALAIDAALHPADGDWYFFVPVNLKTGETVFSTTPAEHEAAAARLRSWCRESQENATYCE